MTHREQEPHPDQRPFQSFTFTPIHVQRLRQHASQSGATINDIIVAASILAIHGGTRNKASQKSNRSPCQSTYDHLVPGNLPAIKSVMHSDRHPNQLQEPHETIKSIAEASRWIQHSAAAGMFLIALGFFLKRTRLLRLITRLPLCFSTAVVSNIGNVQGRTGKRAKRRSQHTWWTYYHEHEGVPPVRPGTALSVGITNYCNQLTITTMTDSRQLSPDDRAELTMLIQSQIDRIAPGPSQIKTFKFFFLPKSTTLTAD